MRTRNIAAVALASALALSVVGCGSNSGGDNAASGEGKETVAGASDGIENSQPEQPGVTTIYLARHGETWLNDLDLVQGWTDSPLTEEGQEQALAFGCGLAKSGVQFDAAYSADMVRHFETATLALEGAGESDLAVERRTDLREIAFGKYEGRVNGDMWGAIAENMAKQGKDLSDASIMEIFDVNAEILSGEHEKAETGTETAARAANEILRIASEVEEAGGGDVLVVSSGITIALALEKLGVDSALLGGPIPNGAVTTLVYDGEKLEAVDVNNTEFQHLCEGGSQSE